MTGEISGMAGRSRRRSVGYATPSGEIVTRRKWRGGGNGWSVVHARASRRLQRTQPFEPHIRATAAEAGAFAGFIVALKRHASTANAGGLAGFLREVFGYLVCGIRWGRIWPRLASKGRTRTWGTRAVWCCTRDPLRQAQGRFSVGWRERRLSG